MSKVALPSVQSLLIEMQFNGQTLSTATAFLAKCAKDVYLITNRHNVTGRNQETGDLLSKSGGIPNQVSIWHNKKGSLGQWISKIEPLLINGVPCWYEHPKLGLKADFVALPLTDLIDVELFPYDLVNLGPDIFVGPADSISVVGFPFGIAAGGVFGVWATGFLASEPAIDYSGLPIQLIDCRSRQGQSGSPVIAYRSGGMVAMVDGGSAAFGQPVSRLIGIYSGRINNESDIGIVWKTSAIKELLDSL